ncbi:MAG: choice-of-anchor D domain-containing protein [Verrucomicrobiales bacterium]
MDNNDADEDPYTFQVAGTGLAEAALSVRGRSGGGFTPWEPIYQGSATPQGANGTQFAAAAVAGGTVERNFQIESTGDAVLSITSITSDLPDFQIVDAPSVLSPGQTGNFDIVFDPTQSGPRDGTITIASNAEDHASFTFAVAGFGWDNVGPRIRMQGSYSLLDLIDIFSEIAHDNGATGILNGTDFGSVKLGRPDGIVETLLAGEWFEPNLFRIHNDGAQPLVIDSITVDSSHYTLGAYRASLSYAQFLWGSPSLEEAITVPPGDSFTFFATFKPSVHGRHDATITIAGNAVQNEPFLINLTGFGDARDDGPDITFFDVDTGGILKSNWQPSFRATLGGTHEREFRIVNAGNEILTIGGATSSEPARFTIADMPSVLAPGAEAVFRVTYHAPATDGEIDAVITIPNNDPDARDSPYEFQVHGKTGVPRLLVGGVDRTEIPNGSDVPTEAQGTDFGTADPAGPPVVREFLLLNSDALATLYLDRIDTNSPSFTVVAAPSEIPPGDTAALAIAFQPLGGGTEERTVSIFSDDPDDNPYTFAIAGDSTGVSAPPVIVGFELFGEHALLSFTTSPSESYGIGEATDLGDWRPAAGQSGIQGTGGVVSRWLWDIRPGDYRFFSVGEE